MDRAISPPFASAAARRAARRRWAARSLAGLLLACSLAYASLPLWLPVERVRAHLEWQLSQDFGVPVRIARVQAGWIDGVVIEDLTLADTTPGVQTNLAHVGRIRCDLSPFTLLANKKLRLLEILEPQVWLHIDADGRLRLPLKEQRGGSLPSYNYLIRNLTCHVATPQVTQSFRIDRLDLQLDPTSGLLHLSSVTRVKRPHADEDEPEQGRLNFNANIRIPRLKRTEPLDGNIEVDWTDLALNDLPVPLISRVPVEQVDGTTSGRLTIQTRPDLAIDYAVGIIFDGVQIMRPELNRPAQVPDAELSCSGRWDPAQGLMMVRKLAWETPSVKVYAAQADLPAIRVEEKGVKPFELHLAGTIKNWQGLRSELPELDHWARVAGADLQGSSEFSIDAVKERRTERLRVELQGQDSSWNIRQGDVNVLTADRGLSKRLTAEITRNQTDGRIRVPALALTLGGLSLQVGAETFWNPPETASATGTTDALVNATTSLAARAELRCAEASALNKLLPWLAELSTIDELSGPLHLRLQLEPQDAWSSVRVAGELGEACVLRYADLLYKPRGLPLRWTAALRLPYGRAAACELLDFELRYGPGRFELATGSAGFEYDLGFSETFTGRRMVGAECTWRPEINVESVETLIDLAPRARKLIEQNGITFISGNLGLEVTSSLSYRPRDSILRNDVRVTADGLACRWKDTLSKPAGEPLTVGLTHHLRQGAQWTDTFQAVTVSRPSGKMTASLLCSNADQGDQDSALELVGLQVELDDLADWARIAAELMHQAGLESSGSFSATARELRLGGRKWGQAKVNADRAGICWNPNGIRKPAGVPARASLAWQVEPEPTTGAGETWRIKDSRLQFAGFLLDRLECEWATSPSAQTAGGHGLLAAVKEGKVHAAGHVLFDGKLDELHPSVRKQIENAALKGRAEWELNLEVGPDVLACSAQVNATDAAFRAGPDRNPELLVEKRSGDPVVASLSFSTPRAEPLFPRTLSIDRLALQASTNSLAASGQLDLGNRKAAGREGDLLALDSCALNLAADLPDLSTLHGLMPNCPLQTLRGAVQASARMEANKQKAWFSKGRAEFENVQLGPTERALRLDGAVAGVPGKLNLEYLDWTWGQSAGSLSGLLLLGQDGYELTLGLGGGELVIEDLLGCADELIESIGSNQDNDTHETTTTSSEDRTAQVLDLLRRTRATVQGHVGTLTTPLPLNIKAVAEAGWTNLSLQDSTVNMEFGCIVDGGRVTGQMTADLIAESPEYRLTYTAERIEPGSVVDAYLRRTFPGMIATGPLTLIDETVQKLLPAPGEPNPEIGKGELIIDGGTVSGRAAPLWMTRIFPGLNLASFEFSRMHSWFDKTEEGRVHHQMIYHGNYYNVYMIGWSDIAGHFAYEVGIDFLAGLESEYWANSGQGRVPLFTKTGQVREDGSLADETVNFVSITRVLETLFVRNNPVVTAYYAVRKRVGSQ